MFKYTVQTETKAELAMPQEDMIKRSSRNYALETNYPLK